MIAELNNIIKRYNHTLALDCVSLDIEEGDMIGLLGPNGAGKTTLLLALLGLINVDSGDIKVFNKDMKGDLQNIRRDIGFVTQDISIFEDLTAEENLKFFGGIYGLKGEELNSKVLDALKIVGLENYRKKLPEKFSGGMKRRLNIATALVHTPKFLIMDEPTVGIDPQSRNHILDTVRLLHKKGTTILYTTHYIEEVQALADRIVILDQGNVIANGTLDELVDIIQHEEKILITVHDSNINLLEALNKLNGIKQVMQKNRKIEIIAHKQTITIDQLSEACKSAGGIESINYVKPTLEDVFLTLTGKTLRDEQEIDV